MQLDLACMTPVIHPLTPATEVKHSLAFTFMDHDPPVQTSAQTIPGWVDGLGSAGAPETAQDVDHDVARDEMSWELRTDSVGPTREYEEVSDS